MGDRVIVQIIAGSSGEHSPQCYMHWRGTEAPEYIRELALLMHAERSGDVSYAFGRMVGIAHSHIEGCLSLGVWNAEARLTEADSPGDAGIYIVNCDTWDVEALGGYGRSFNALEPATEEQTV